MTHAPQPSIQHLLQTLCPNGVEWKTLGDVCSIATGKLNANAMTDNGKYAFFTCSDTIFKTDTYAFDCEALLVAGNGYIGNIKHYKGKFNVYQRTYVLYKFINSSIIRFVYHYLETYFRDYAMKQQNEASVPYITLGVLSNFSIPLPPLAIQERIVEILDKFSMLSAELEAELELRKKQYDFYRNRLLSFDSISDTNTTEQRNKGYYPLLITYKTLGEIGTMTKGNGIQKSDFQEEGYPCIHYGQVHTYYGTFTYKTKSFISEDLAQKCKKAHTGDLIIATTSEDVEACCKSTAWLGEGDVAVSGDAHIFSHNQNPKYIAYLFQTEMFRQQKKKVATGTKVVRVSGDSILKFTFPLPPLPVQERIVGILDKFETLVSDLSQGLPAEINLVQKQYEYYRNQLLTF